MGGHLSNLLRILKHRQKPDSFASHFEQHFNTTTSHTNLRKYMNFKVVKQLNLIGTMKTLMKTQLQSMYGGTFNDPKIYAKNASRL